MIPIDTSLVMFHNNHAGWHNKANNVRGYRLDERLDEIGELIKGPLEKGAGVDGGSRDAYNDLSSDPSGGSACLNGTWCLHEE